MTDETRQVISDYLAGCRTRDPKFATAVQRVTAMTFLSKPELQWDVILEAVRQASDGDLDHIAAGPIEGLLGWHGAEWVERVEAEARQNEKFARVMTGVWKYKMSDDVWDRVKAVKELVPLEQWLPAGLKERANRPAS